MAAIGASVSVDAKWEHTPFMERVEAARTDLTRISLQGNDPKAALMTLRDEAYTCMIQVGLGQVVNVSFGETGFHPWNRSTAGISPSNALEKLVNFAKSGVTFNNIALYILYTALV
jgi:hypothetical protein